jgi:hypothetical protein
MGKVEKSRYSGVGQPQDLHELRLIEAPPFSQHLDTCPRQNLVSVHDGNLPSPQAVASIAWIWLPSTERMSGIRMPR